MERINTKEIEIADPSGLKDEEILTLSVKKPNAFRTIVDRYQEPFLKKARKILGTDENAQDAVQETFVKIYLKASKFKHVEGAAFSSWAYKILLNTCFTEYRKLSRTRRFSVPMDEELEAVLGDEGGFAKRLSLDYFLSIISRIPLTTRKVLQLSVLEGLSPKDIAEREGVSVGAVRTRIHRAKKEFQKITLGFA